VLDYFRTVDVILSCSSITYSVCLMLQNMPFTHNSICAAIARYFEWPFQAMSSAKRIPSIVLVCNGSLDSDAIFVLLCSCVSYNNQSWMAINCYTVHSQLHALLLIHELFSLVSIELNTGPSYRNSDSSLSYSALTLAHAHAAYIAFVSGFKIPATFLHIL
jgi:hypothetical protein